MKTKKLAILALVAAGLFVFCHYSASAERKCLELGNSVNQCAKLKL